MTWMTIMTRSMTLARSTSTLRALRLSPISMMVSLMLFLTSYQVCDHDKILNCEDTTLQVLMPVLLVFLLQFLIDRSLISSLL